MFTTSLAEFKGILAQTVDAKQTRGLVSDREETIMRRKVDGWAKKALKQQIEIFGEDQVSLDSLWRAVASPCGHDPRSWADMANPLLAGFATYRRRLQGETDTDTDSDTTPLLWIWREGSKDPWLTGDVMTHEFIAWAYASYLDELSRTAPATCVAGP